MRHPAGGGKNILTSKRPSANYVDLGADILGGREKGSPDPGFYRRGSIWQIRNVATPDVIPATGNPILIRSHRIRRDNKSGDKRGEINQAVFDWATAAIVQGDSNSRCVAVVIRWPRTATAVGGPEVSGAGATRQNSVENG